jgi:predicted membrane protein
LILALVRGASPFAAAGTSLGAILCAYFAAGLVAGALFGILRPLGRTGVGAAALGIVVAFPVLSAVGLALEDPARWLTRVPLIAFIGSATVGPVAGLAMFFVDRKFREIGGR